MKKLILAAFVGLTANAAMAQNINFGIKGGVVFNTDKGEVMVHDLTKFTFHFG